MLDVQAFKALCENCRQLKTVDLVGWYDLHIYESPDRVLKTFAVQVGIMTLKDEQLECMCNLGHSLRRVRLGGNICLSPSTIATFLQKAGRNLLELDLAGCQVNDEVRFCACAVLSSRFLEFADQSVEFLWRCHATRIRIRNRLLEILASCP